MKLHVCYNLLQVHNGTFPYSKLHWSYGILMSQWVAILTGLSIKIIQDLYKDINTSQLHKVETIIAICMHVGRLVTMYCKSRVWCFQYLYDLMYQHSYQLIYTLCTCVLSSYNFVLLIMQQRIQDLNKSSNECITEVITLTKSLCLQGISLYVSV